MTFRFLASKASLMVCLSKTRSVYFKQNNVVEGTGIANGVSRGGESNKVK